MGYDRLFLPYDKIAESLIEEGDFLLFNGTSCTSYAIKKASDGVHSHAAMASWRGKPLDSLLECVEFKEWKGGRTTSLRNQVSLFSKQIDVFRPISPIKTVMPKYIDGQFSIVSKTINYNGRLVTNTLRELTGLPYGWKRIIWLSQYHLPFIRWLSKLRIDDNDELIYPVCSTVLSYCVRKHYVDLIKFKPDSKMEPADLARSPLLTYLFTLEKDW